MSDSVELQVEGEVCIARIAGAGLFRPQLLEEFGAMLDVVEREHPGQPLLTTGADKFFSNGFDLDYLGSLQGADLMTFIDDACRLLGRMMTFPAPTIAAINGHAFGVGAMLALTHDQRIMRADRGWFCLPEVDLKMTFHPFMKALVRDRLGVRTAEEAVLSGRRYDGNAALAAGIMHATADAESLMARAFEMLDSWTGKDPTILGKLKAQFRSEVTLHTPAPRL